MEAAEVLLSFGNEMEMENQILRDNNHEAEKVADQKTAKHEPLQEITNSQKLAPQYNSLPVSGPTKRKYIKRGQPLAADVDKENASTTRVLRSSKRLKKSVTSETNNSDKSKLKTNKSDSVIDQEVISFLAEQWGKSHRTNSPVEVSRKSVQIQENVSTVNSTFTMSPIRKNSVSFKLPEYETVEKNLSPIQQVQLSFNEASLNKSVEIPIIAYDSDYQEILKTYEINRCEENLDLNKTTQTNEINPQGNLNLNKTTKKITKIVYNPAEIALNMSCHSDDDYDFEHSSPFSDLQEELDENNNLILTHRKLKSFVVTSDLNRKFGLDSDRIHNENSRVLFGDLNTLEKGKLLNFKELNEPLAEDNYNFRLLQGLFVQLTNEDDMGLTVCREGDIDYGNYTSPLALPIEQVARDLEEQAAAKKLLEESARVESVQAANEKTNVIEKEHFIPKKIRRRKKESAEDEEIDFAFEEAHKIFSIDELATGIFCEINKKGVNINKSKTRIGLDEGKTYELKERIKHQFQIKTNKIDEVWKFLRAGLNKQLYARYSKK